MSGPDRYPSYTACVAKALSAASRPLDVDELVHEVAAERPLGSLARNSVYRALGELFQAVPVGSGRYGWLSSLLEGSTFCHPLTGDEIARGYIQLDELEHSVFFPQFFQDYEPDDRTVEITLFGGPTLRVEPVIERKVWSLALGQPYVDWLAELGVESRDDMIIWVDDAVQGKYEIRARLRQMRDEQAIERRNTRLSMLAEKIVVEDSRKREFIPTWDLVARLIGRGFFQEPVPPDDLHYVLHEYSLLRFAEGLGYQLDTAAEPQHTKQAGGGSASGFLPIDDDIMRRLRAFIEPDRDGEDADPGDPYGDLEPYIMDQDEAPYLEGEEGEQDDEICPAYQQYLESYMEDDSVDQLLEHDEFHLLEAELDMLLQLEAEFGGLLDEQVARKESLAARLYIDPDELASMGWDMPDEPPEDPPFWSN